MKTEKWEMQWQVFADPADLPPAERSLLGRAVEALGNAYAPYSNFLVGAAALLENGEVVPGFNIENAAYPLCLCAERVALAAAESGFPGIPVDVLAITVRSARHDVQEPASPCGACRQVLFEKEWRQGSNIRIILRGATGPVYVLPSAQSLLPLSFDPDFL